MTRSSTGDAGANAWRVGVVWLIVGAAAISLSPLRGVADARAFVQREERQEGEPLEIDARGKRARLTLRAGANGVNGGMSFNGAHRGGRLVVLPVGWRLQVTLINDDNALPHSVMVVPMTDSIPSRVTSPAFNGAATDGAGDGTLVGDSAEFTFTADRAGEYWLFCAVPGHGKAGMYLRLTVSRAVTVPRYQ